MVAASLMSVVAAAQVSQPGPRLDIPDNVNFVGPTQTGVRKATAIVNGDVITETDIEHRLALALSGNEAQLSPQDMQRLRAQVFRNLIDESLQIQAAAQQEIPVENREVDRFYAQVAQRYNRTPEVFTEFLRSIGSSDRSLKRQIRAEIAWSRLQSRQIEPFVNVGEDEVQAILDRLNASRGTAEFRVAEIFLSATPETSAEVGNNAARIVQQIRAGGSFPVYARQFSEASTAAVGGDLGWVRAEQLPPELANLVTQMPVGAVSDPISVPGGFSIVALADSRQILVADPRDAQLSLLQMAIDLPAGTTEAQARARANQLGQATRNMGGCGRAQEVATSLGAQIVTDERRVREIGSPQMEQLLLSLNVGEVTPPFGDIQQIRVIVLCGRDDPPPATGPTADQLAESILQARVNSRAQRYLRDLRRDAVIDYR